MYTEESYEAIKLRMLNSLNTDLDKREGSFINDMYAPMSTEFARFYLEMDSLHSIFYIEDCYGENLDKRVVEFGVPRKLGERARGTLTFKGDNGVLIPRNIQISTDGGFLYTTISQGYIKNGTVDILVEANEVGTKYNAESYSSWILPKDIVVVEIVNTQAFTGGVDTESDDDLKKRFFDSVQNKRTSGNVNDYLYWAKEVAGVQNAECYPLWNGPGTVKVIASDENRMPLTEETLRNCDRYIQEMRPLGANVTVTTTTIMNVSIASSIIIDSNYNASNVIEKVHEAIRNYVHSCIDKIYYNKLVASIINVEGVIDYVTLTINGSNNATIPVPVDSVAKVNSIVVDEYTEGQEPPPTSELTLDYVFTNQSRGTASGTITLKSFNSTNDGEYIIYWANASGVLNDFEHITKFTMSGVSDTKTYTFIDTNAIPSKATKIVATKGGNIVIEKNLPTTKLLNTPVSYSVGLVSDIHIDGDGSDSSESITDFEKAIALFKSKKVSAICSAGDVTYDGRQEDLNAFKNIKDTKLTDLDFFTARGNHDVLNACANTETYTTFVDPNGVLYEKSIGGDVYLFAGINSSYTSEPNELDWLENRFELYKNKRVFFFYHIFLPPVGNIGGLYPYGDATGVITLTPRLHELCKKYRNVIYFSGHSHLDFSLQRLGKNANCSERTDSLCHRVHIPSLAKPRLNDNTTPDTPENTYQQNAGSLGYVMDVYPNTIVLQGYDFSKAKFLPYAQYILDVTPIKYTTNTEIFRLSTTGFTNSGFDAYGGLVVNNDKSITINSPSAALTFTTFDLTPHVGKKLYCYTENMVYSAGSVTDKVGIYFDLESNNSINTGYQTYSTEYEVLRANSVSTNLLSLGTDIRLRLRASSSSTMAFPCTITMDELVVCVDTQPPKSLVKEL